VDTNVEAGAYAMWNIVKGVKHICEFELVPPPFPAKRGNYWKDFMPQDRIAQNDR
jgi:hypothetical protein